MTVRPRIHIVGALFVLFGSTTAFAEGNTELARIDSFLQRHNARQAISGLTHAEKVNLDRTLNVRDRKIPDQLIGKLLKNPVAWQGHGRKLLSSVIRALPEIANIPGSSKALTSACNPNEANFRGFGFELVASAALMRYREPNGVNPRVVRMSADIRGSDGRMRESDGCCVFSGTDQRQRLVTMKSVMSQKALKRAVHKATSQLAVRNGSQEGIPREQIKPGVMMLGYSDPAVLQSARQKNWGAAANRTGAKLLVLAVNQIDGRVTRLASVAPTSTAVPRARCNLRPANGATFQQREQRRQSQRRSFKPRKRAFRR
jgi:hypothetical protein